MPHRQSPVLRPAPNSPRGLYCTALLLGRARAGGALGAVVAAGLLRVSSRGQSLAAGQRHFALEQAALSLWTRSQAT